MKNIFKTLIPCLVLVLGLTGCYDEMDDKATVDAKYESTDKPTVTLSSVEAIDFSSIDVSGTISTTENILEAGFMYATDESFHDATCVPMDEVTESFNGTIAGLVEQTTYYVRSYAVTVAAGTAVSEATSVTTPAAPVFELNGVYTAVDYSAEDDSAGESYEVTIEFVSGSTTDIEITNLWGGGMTINAKYDPETGKVSIPAKQVIYVHASYGDVWMEDVNGSESISGLFTPKGGFLNINTFSAICGAGTFGDQYVKMSHK